ncbi:MAG TPA: formyl transferase [Terriglobales bacterium]|nr:formyl transferase [Terriglobales bacterium]
MRVVLITGNSFGHRYVANKLASAVELAGIVVDEGARGGLAEWRRLWKRYTLRQMGSRLALRCLAIICNDAARRQLKAKEILGAEDCLNFHFPNLITGVRGVNSKESMALLESLQPDVLLVFGTAVVRAPVLSLARKIALNLHTGISPYYRGADCYFWPIYNNDLRMLGATVHECTAQIDGGRIFATGHASLEADDDIFSVFFRCVAQGAELYVNVVQDLVAGRLAGGTPQNLNVGREYRAFMRGIKADVKVRLQVKRGLIRRYVLANPQNFGTRHPRRKAQTTSY